MKFDEILSNEDLLDALWDMHFDDCTPIQAQGIPPVLEGRDLLAVAQTGTGKTAAYLLPIIECLVEDGYPSDCVNAVIMAPTRELAQQIDQQMQGFSYYVPVTSAPVYGGTDGDGYNRQRKSLKSGADVVIATPGRLLAHLSMGYVDLSKVSFFVLDEADRMLDMGFLDDIMQIVGRLPKDRQTLLFSATMPPKIQALAKNLLKDPVQVKLAVSKPAEKIQQSAYVCYETQKLPILKDLFTRETFKKVIIFSSSKLKVKELARTLKGLKLNVAEMHSDLAQTAREDVMLRFKAGHVNIIVATDILARGIDIDDIELVINYDVPREAEDYVHRIGRTARADRDGRAITFVSEKDRGKFRNIERLLEKEVPKNPVDEALGCTPGSAEECSPGNDKRPGRKERPGRTKSGRRRGKPSGRKENTSSHIASKSVESNPADSAPKHRRSRNRRRKPAAPNKAEQQ